MSRGCLQSMQEMVHIYAFYPRSKHVDPKFVSDRWNNESFHFILYTLLCCSNFQLKTCAPFIVEKASAKKEDCEV